MPEDLLKFGLIPELIGRLPLVVALENLDEKALLNILTQPKNAITKQYEKLFLIDGVKLEFEKQALEAIVKRAIQLKTGARGLRAIMETIMMDIMFEIPARKDIVKCIIKKDTVDNGSKPQLILSGSKKKTLKAVEHEESA